jgi:hypothetical protein
MERLRNTVSNRRWRCAYAASVKRRGPKGKAKTEIYMGEKSIKAIILE